MRVAIVEDDKIQAETLKKYVDDYRRTHDYGTGETLVFGNGETFLGYCEKNSADIVFMDIVMPGMDGMTVCEKIRERNSSMIIVFVTDMAQFAVRGYKADALDYIVKPVTEGGFRLAMDRAFRKAAGRAGAVISVRNGLGNRTSERGNGTCGGRRRRNRGKRGGSAVVRGRVQRAPRRTETPLRAVKAVCRKQGGGGRQGNADGSERQDRRETAR